MVIGYGGKIHFGEGTQASQPATRLEDAIFIIAGKMPAYPACPMFLTFCFPQL